MREVTDPDLLRRLESGEGKVASSNRRGQEVTDPALLSQLNKPQVEEPGIFDKVPLSFSDRIKKPNDESLISNFMTPAGALQMQGGKIGENPIGRATLEAVGSIPFGLGGGIEAIGSRLAARNAPKLAQGAADLAGMIGKNAAFGATTSAINPQQEGSVAERALQGALWGAGLGATGKGVSSLVENLRPSRFLRGKLSPLELTRNLNVTRGTNTGLGDVLGSPYLKKKLENTLLSTPGSGASDIMQTIGKQVEEKGHNLLTSILGKDNSGENIPKQIYDTLNEAHESHRATKNALYTEANKIADKEKIKLDLGRFSDAANKYSSALEDTNILKYEPDAKYLFTKLVNYKNPIEESKNIGSIVDKSGKPLINESTSKYPTLEEANLLKGKLNQYAKSLGASPDADKRSLSKVFGNLASNLRKDIQDSVGTGSDNLKQAYKKAEENYAKNYSSFLDKDIYKFIGGNADPETIVDKFITTSNTKDLAGKLSKLTKTLPDNDKKLLSYGYFASRALDQNGEINPAKLATAITKLGKNQFKNLVPDDALRQSLKDYSKLAKFNAKAQYLMANPETGQKNLSAITALMHGASGVLGAGIGAKEGGFPGAIAGAAGGYALPMMAGRAATKYLTSPEIRENLVRKMIENKKLPGGNFIMGLMQSLQNHGRETK